MNWLRNKLKIGGSGFLMIIFLLLPLAQAKAIPGVPDPVFLLDPPTTAQLAAIVASTATSATANAAAAASLVTLNLSIGVPGVEQAISTGLGAVVSEACNGIGRLQQIAGTSDSFSSLSSIAGSPAEATQLTTKLAALIAWEKCDTVTLAALEKLPATSLMLGQELARRQQVLNDEIAALDIRIESLKTRQSASFKDVLKAIVIKLILTYSQKLTTKMVNALVAKYKISNYLKYANAVGGLVYEVDYVRNNYPNNSDQLILRSLLQNQGFQDSVLPMVTQQAKKNLGYEASQLNVTDPNYYAKIAMSGSPQANPYFLQSSYQNQASNVRAQGAAAAQSEIQQSQGFIPVRNCTGAVQQQQQIDKQIDQLSNQYVINSKAFDKVQAAYDLNPTDKQKQQLDLARAALNRSDASLLALPTQLDKGFLEMCQAISNPGAFVGNSIQNFLKSHLDQANTLNNNNLPFYGQFLQAVATNLINNIIVGGGNTTKLLTEAGIDAANLATDKAVETWSDSQAQDSVGQNITNQQNAIAQTAKNGATFQAAMIPNSASQFQLLWDVSGYQSSDGTVGADFVTLIGGSLPPSSALQAGPISGSVTANFPNSGSATYTINIYRKGQIPGQDAPVDQLTLNVTKGATSNIGIVFGANTNSPRFSVRGAAVSFSPRGQ